MNLNIQTSQFLTALLNGLDEYFPNQIPLDKTVTIEDLRERQGEQNVINYLRALQVADEDDATYEK